MNSSRPSLSSLLEAKHVAILDGGLGSELEDQGEDIKGTLWSSLPLLSRPDAIERVHAKYLDAGADILLTCSYQTSFHGFNEAGVTDRTRQLELFQETVKLARRCTDKYQERPVMVALSCGPYGSTLSDGSEFTGVVSVSREALVGFHTEKVQALLGRLPGGPAQVEKPDIVAFETLPSLLELGVILDVIPVVLTPDNLKCWISFSCKDGEHLNSGEPFAEAVQAAARCEHVVAIGVNCTNPNFVSSLLAIAAPITTKPLVVYSNRGEEWNVDSQDWKSSDNTISSCTNFVEFAKQWSTQGARVIGGCCRITPDMNAGIASEFNGAQ